ncbi:DUF4258 domain-containing protein [Evansella clarkii]|uniref:DUF4258 domain-containing protein n=1 Tax=Evansella clarkii TaxID=79879 RepID=UPI0009965766|nr:DUF4258 domain-containing protein [Evansella clarkii]
MILYSLHAKQRMNLRVISETEIKNALEHGRVIKTQEDGRIVVHHNRVRVVFAIHQQHVTIVTVMPDKAFEKHVRHLAKKENLSMKQATKKLKNIA